MYKLNQTQIDNIRNMNDFVKETSSLLENIKNIEIPDIPINTNNETVFIEFRNMIHIEYLIRNMILTLPDWSHTIICGNNNIENIKKYNIHPNLKIINLGRNNLDRKEYNKLLLTEKFWNNFVGEKLLIYQSDSIIFHNNINQFLEYDYVGALWKRKYNNLTKVGNGGFSLRSKKIMLECLNKVKKINYSYNEDMWYTQQMIKLKIGKLADEQIAKMFSQEYIKSENPLGGHKYWLANKEFHNVRLVNKKIEEKKERVIEDKNIKKKYKICIIYHYYERKNENKNQTNLSFFIKYGLNKKKWKKFDITTLFIINNKQCEVLIPIRNDIIIWKRDYNNEYDIGSYKLGIEYMEKKYNKKFYDIFSHLFIINAGVFGPIYNEDINKHWIEPYLEKMEKENSVLCTPVINFLKHSDPGGYGPRCQSYCSLIKIDEKIYNLLLNTKISNISEKTTNKNYPLHYDYVFTTHKKHYNTILIGEYGLTRILLNNNYNISCLIYDNIDYFNEKEYEKYSHRIDRFDDYKEEYFDKCIFIKNNWIINPSTKDSLPVLYDKTKEYYYDKLNLKNIEIENIVYNHDFLQIPKEIELMNHYNKNKLYKCLCNSQSKLNDCIFYCNNKIKVCNNKKEGYEKFGYSEEVILWPQMKKNNKSVLIYCHYDKDNIIKNYVIETLRTYIILEYDIIFCTTSEKINNVDLPFKINYFKNRDDIKQGNDLNMFHQILITTNLDIYDWITFLNDSILLPIHGIENMKNTINKYRLDNDIWGLYLSHEIEIHICTCHFEFNKKCIPILTNFFNEKMNQKFKNSYDLIRKVEVKMINYMSNFNIKYDGVVRYDNLVNGDKIHILRPQNTYKYINRKEVFGFKWKYFGNFLNYEKLNNKTLNYLMRYLELGEKIPNIR